MSIEKIREFIEALSDDALFAPSAIMHLSSKANCEVVLSRMVKAGELFRFRDMRGVYGKIKHRPSCMMPPGCGLEGCPTTLDCGADLTLKGLGVLR